MPYANPQKAREHSRLRQRAYVARHRTRVLSQRRVRYEANGTALRADSRQRMQHKRANPVAKQRLIEQHAKCQSRWVHNIADTLRRYGLTLDQYHAKCEAQDWCCAICGDYMSSIHVDHDHATGRVRSLLCGTCNPGIGMFKESIKRLKNAALYLHKWKKLNAA